MAAALLRQGARRIGGSVFQRAQAAVTSSAVAEERRRQLVRPSRRMYITEEEIKAEIKRLEIETELRYQAELRDRASRLKPHQICWELYRMFPAFKIFNMVVSTTALYIAVSAAISLKEDEKKVNEERKVNEARKKSMKACKKQQQ